MKSEVFPHKRGGLGAERRTDAAEAHHMCKGSSERFTPRNQNQNQNHPSFMVWLVPVTKLEGVLPVPAGLHRR